MPLSVRTSLRMPVISPSIAVLRWLDWIFWGWYLPTLSINYVGMSKDMEKRLPQLYYKKIKVVHVHMKLENSARE